MKLAILFLVCIFIFVTVDAQSFAVAADSMNIAYIGSVNPLSIVSDNTSCAELIATTDNGTMVKKDSCHFFYSPEREGVAIIKIQKKHNGKILPVGQMPIRCRIITDPVAKVGHKMTGNYPLALFKAQSGIQAEVEGCEMDVMFKVISYRVTVFKNKKPVYTQNVVGNRFSDDVSNVFKELKSGDIVQFDNIKATGADTEIRILNELVFTML